MRRTFAGIAVFLLLFALMGSFGPTLPKASAADEFDSLREKWRDVLTGGSAINLDDADIANQIALTVGAAQNEAADGFWDTLQTGTARTNCGCLWTDLTSTTVSAELVYNFGRIRALALAYATVGSDDPDSPAYSPLYRNEALRDDILSALDWMYDNRYNETKSIYNNWYHWEMSGPRHLLDTVVLMYDELSSTQIDNYMAAIAHFSPDPNRAPQNSATSTGANRVEKSWVVALRGILAKDGTAIALARDGLSDATSLATATGGANSVFVYADSGDGMHTDGSFLQHTAHPYFGNYGTTFFQYIVNLVYLLNGSTWEVTDSDADNVYRWVYDTFEPAIYQGSLLSPLRGRTVAYSTADDHYYGVAATQAVLLLSTFAPASDAAVYRSMTKEWIVRDTYRSFIGDGNSIFYIVMAKELVSDSSVLARGELVGNFAFPQADRVVHYQSGYGFALAMSSSRIYRYESINGDNLHGWHTGDGMTYLYNGDLSQYDADYWPAVDPYRLAGTTVDKGTLANAAGQSTYTSKSWVGGASDGAYGAAGMEMNPYGSTLAGMKSWFMFDDEIAALGAGIGSTSGRTIETIVDNRKLNGTGDNTLTVDGTAQSTSLAAGTQSYASVSWMHLAGNAGIGSDIGYFFPEMPSLKTLRETRTGYWTDIHSGSVEAGLKTNRFQAIWFDHGTNPTGASYQYVLLPGKSTSGTAAYAASPDISVLENSSEAQGVEEASLNVQAINFWQSAVKTVGDVTSDSKASVLLKTSSAEAVVTVADPTQTNAGTIQLEIARSATGVLSLDPGIVVTQLSPTIKLTADVNGLKGQSRQAKFDLSSGSAAPAAPVLREWSGGSDRTTLGWYPVAGAAGYRIDYGTAPGVYTASEDVGAATTGTVSGLTAGTTYYFAVAAYNSSASGSYSDELRLVSLLPEADAYVRNGAYAAENYGASSTLVVKNSSTGYSRQAFLRFDLSALSAPVAGAKLRIVPTYAGSASASDALATTTGSWTESGITWNNKPAIGSAIGTWSSMTAGVPVEIDVTDEVNAAIASGAVSFAVYAPSDTGSSGDVIYGAKEQATAANRPALAVNP